MEIPQNNFKPSDILKGPLSHGFRYYTVIFLTVIVFGVIYFISPPLSFPSNGAVLTIVPGENLKQLSSELKKAHYIRSSTIFATFVTLFGSEHKILPGDYFFEKPASSIKIAKQISEGRHNLDPIKVTFPEGENVREMSVVLSNKLPDFDQELFKNSAKTEEGYLFPDTYFFYPRTAPQDIISEMKKMYTKRTATIFKENKSLHTEKDIIIVASLLEREAHGEEDRSIISGIIWKRLELAMPLQVDATVAYAVDKSEQELKSSDFVSDSLYNTYKYQGLPPGPISNPGLVSILAAMNPQIKGYLYYLHDRHGNIYYARTYAEHQKNIKKYLR